MSLYILCFSIKLLVKQKLWLCFADCMSHHRCATNIAPECQISYATIRHTVVGIGRYRIGSSRVPVSVIRNGHRALPEPSSFPTSVRQWSPKWCFCNSVKNISSIHQCTNNINLTYGYPKRLERAPPLLHFRTKSTSCYGRHNTLSDLLGFAVQIANQRKKFLLD